MLPSFPIDEELQTLHKFPYIEGKQYEFKQNFNGIRCILPTICAFLNEMGGYMVFGITDNLFINGLNITNKEKDKILLDIDSVYHNKSIVYNDSLEPIDTYLIKTRFVNIHNNKCLLIIAIYPTYKLCLVNGITIYRRLNASNYIIPTVKAIYTESEITKYKNESITIQNKFLEIIKNIDKEKIEYLERFKNAKKIEEQNNRFIETLHKSILVEKDKMEKLLKSNSNWYLYLCLC